MRQLSATDISVHAAALDDVDDLAGLCRAVLGLEALLEAGEDATLPEVSAVAEKVRQEITNVDAGQALLVAKVRDAVLGCARVRVLPADGGEEQRQASLEVAVTCGQPAQTIAQELVAGAERWARAQGATSVLVACDPHNRNAIDFYTGTCGFRAESLSLVKSLPQDQASRDASKP